MASNSPPLDDQPQLADLVRILDVAAEMRADRELATRELAVDETKEMLRERLLASAKLTGDTATPEEIQAAIEHYYQSLHTFREPRWSMTVALAHLYVRRVRLFLATTAVLVLVVGWSLTSPTPPTPRPLTSSVTPAKSIPTVPAVPISTDNSSKEAGLEIRPTNKTMKTPEATENVSPPVDPIQSLLRNVESLATTMQEGTVDPSATELIHEQLARLHVAAKVPDLSAMQEVRQQLLKSQAVLDEEYEVRVLSDPKAKSGMDRYFKDSEGKRVSGYYLLVEAHSAGGRLLPRPVTNAETGKTETVTTWGESVSDEVWERIKADKKADGILDETLFAVKKRGQLTPQIVMKGVSGNGRRQITRW